MWSVCVQPVFGLMIVIAAMMHFRGARSDHKTGLYIDNGHDQTEFVREMPSSDEETLKKEILDMLDISSRPPRVNCTRIRTSAPKFLYNIYKTLQQDDEGESGHDEAMTSRSGRRAKRDTSDRSASSSSIAAALDLSGEEKSAIDASDIIMTFENIEHQASGGVRHEKGRRLWFNVTDIPIADDILGAELRIYQRETAYNDTQNYTITLYGIANTDLGEPILEIITMVNTTRAYTGWLKLNTSSILPGWVAFPHSNKGVYLAVHPTNKPGHEIKPEEIGIVASKVHNEENVPFLVAFFKATNHVKPTRSVREVKRNKKRVKKSDYASIMKGFGHDPHESTWRICKIHTLYINFKDLQWQDWIIAPEGYAAYYCAGECNFPLNAHMNATNHAIVQTLVHLMNPLRYPKPCCAPTKLTPISVLYFLDDTNVILKKYKKMVVKSCGCH